MFQWAMRCILPLSNGCSKVDMTKFQDALSSHLAKAQQ
jgi:hypothetical protein